MSDLYIKTPFEINQIACMSAGRILSSYESVRERTAWSQWSIEKKFTFKLIFIAICHDINWDYLQNTLAKNFSEDMDRLSANFLTKINATIIKKWLSDYHKPERIRAEERAALLRDLGRGLIDRFDGNPFNMVLEANGVLYGDKGLDSLLNFFKAYNEDPLRKKANVLTHELVKERILDFHDADKIKPAIEYHIMRLYERTGRVAARSEELQNALRRSQPMQAWFVNQLRGIVSDALIYTAGVAQKMIPDVNYVEWQIARNICLTSEPRCIKHRSAPKELPKDIKKIFKGSCPYISFCAAYSDPLFRKLQEPILRPAKSFY